ncbi:MAG TPA: hypothetical protein DDZ04_00190 [Parabacteroides sp.]|nr:hypothetical protein [Parabacteroides sp.]
MGTSTTQIQSVLETLFMAAIDKMTNDAGGNYISDIYVQADQETGEVQIYDEEEKLVDKTVIFDWVNNTEDEEVFDKRVSDLLRSVLAGLVTKEVFDNPRFIKPLSVSLTDEDFAVIEELLFLDDENLRLDDPILKDLDEDLDDFLSKLLSDVK